MAQSSSIEWTDATWNPVVGCTKVSAGCTNCYAERMAGRLRAMALQAREEGRNAGRKDFYCQVVDARARWTRRVVEVEVALGDPLRWRRPRVVFVNSMSDLFHPDVSTSFIRRVFDVMVAADQHVFQVLTKRPERARELACELPWPENVWMGTSVEDVTVSDRIAHLRLIPSRVRFLSLEPLLGPLDELDLEGVHWVIVGGESGPRARHMNPDWVRSIRDQSSAAQVAFFFKQWGGRNKKATGRTLDGRTWDEMPCRA